MPGGGDNHINAEYDYKEWFTLLPKVVSRFQNCIIVGHSFGGILSLLSPQLEDMIKGLVIINSAPSLYFAAAEKARTENNIPNIAEERKIFSENPNQENYIKLFKAFLPYCFSKKHIQDGLALFEDLPYPFEVGQKLVKLIIDMNYSASFIPQKVPTMLIGGSMDCITPFYLFLEDKRFIRSNIQITEIQDAGHWCWIDQAERIKQLFSEFYNNLT